MLQFAQLQDYDWQWDHFLLHLLVVSIMANPVAAPRKPLPEHDCVSAPTEVVHVLWSCVMNRSHATVRVILFARRQHRHHIGIVIGLVQRYFEFQILAPARAKREREQLSPFAFSSHMQITSEAMLLTTEASATGQ